MSEGLVTEGTLLAVDDNPNNLLLLSGILTRAGYAVRAANSGARALKMIEREAPDLVLLDVNMPEMDGYQVCRSIKSAPELTGVPVIFISALDDVTDKLRGFEAGAVDYVTKPFQEAEVLARVATQLGIHRLRQELTQRNRELLAMNERLVLEQARVAEANRAKSVFLANMSHELRTPLNAVLGFAQLMERRPGRDAEDRESLAIIARSGEHLLGLINDVLSLSRIESGHAALRRAPFDPGALLRGLVGMVRARAEAKGVALAQEVRDLPEYVVGDEGKLGQIVLNLLGNAVKFTSNGTVTLRASWTSGRAVLEVEDTGPGIAPEEADRVFEPFVQAEAGRRSAEGAGLGLALSRQLARLMDGDITVRSAVGRGSSFRVEVALPLAEEGRVSPGAGARPVVRHLSPGQAPPGILVVDAHPEGRALVSRLLGPVGFDVREAATGEEAVALWRRFAPQLVFIDGRLRGLDGHAATRRIREEERVAGRARTRIVALSASALEHERDELLASGCDDFVSKPFRESTLFEKLAEHLGVHYDYEADPGGEGPAAMAIDPVRIRRLPGPIRDDLRAAVESGDFEEAERVAERVMSLDLGLGTALRFAVSSFRFEDVLTALASAARLETGVPDTSTGGG